MGGEAEGQQHLEHFNQSPKHHLTSADLLRQWLLAGIYGSSNIVQRV